MNIPKNKNRTNILNIAATLIAQYEGLSLTPYKCPAGIPTVGYGNTHLEDGTAVTLNMPAITKERARSLLLVTTGEFLEQICPLLTPSTLEDYQIAAILSLTYNIGIGNFKNSTLLKKINDTSFKGDLSPYWLEWNKIGNKMSQGLLNRRKDEYSVFIGKIKSSKGL